ncbi:metal-dependent hydrolase [Pseudonocardiaceae bacterium YIM PH 21723]|nr:metal-dependent hydrolase [Pseudonocardiaceae bacterium YIM PH 21723]
MMGRTHALTGWTAGLAAAPLLGQTTLPRAVLLATVAAGFALLPDLDHRHSTASRFLGPITGAVSWVLRHLSASVYAATKGPRDEPCSGEHRHLSHTVVFAVLLGLAVAATTAAAGRWAVLAVVLVAVLLAEDALGDWVVVPVVVGMGAWFLGAGPSAVLAELDLVSGWLGIVAGLGCIVHCLGDALTLSGCPFLWPVLIRGETWYELRPPALIRFRTGGPAENWLIFPVFAAAAVLLLPGAWPAALELFHRVSEQNHQVTSSNPSAR